MDSKRHENSCGASPRRVSPSDGVPARAHGVGTACDSERLAGRGEGGGESRLLAARVCGESSGGVCFVS
jgi:hypothetical protein